ncbi:SSU ribosomal protein S6E [archaeon GW2011_AR15]|nr:SSU ribosomal protein S6E [archaeon GW2011_AR15]MBS3103999.1 30S ribosomal protein S6e [Candidatus Woesearchaeota archaeon]
MVEFKLSIGDPKSGKTHQIAVSEENANSLLGKKIGDTIKGEAFDLAGYEFEITGGADYCGFPMRKDIEGPVRKQVLITTGVGTRNREAGIRLRRTVCGNTIHERITQVSMKILKHGKTPLGGAPAAEGEAPAEKPAEEPKKKEKPKKEEKPKEHSKEEKKAAPKEEKPAEKKAE